MAVVPRIASLRIQVTVEPGRHRTWTATAAAQDTPEGGSVVITVARVIGFLGSPDEATTLELRYYRDDGTLIRSHALNPAGAFPQTDTYHFTDTGLAGGVASAGTVEIAIYAKREPVAGTIVYEVETDANPNTPGAGNQSLLDRGWIRGTLNATVALSNVALGGGKNLPATYPDSLFARVTLSARLYVARAITVGITNTTPALSGPTNSAQSGNFDVTFTNGVDDRFPAASTVVTTTLTPPNSTLTGLPFTVFTTINNDSITVDSRPGSTHHFQIDDDVFGLAKHDPGFSMLATETGFIWTIIKNARGEGINGLTVVQTLTPVKPGDVYTATGTTTTQDGQAGVSGRLNWTAPKPGGTWNKFADITAPVAIDSDAHLLNSSRVHVLLMIDPNIMKYTALSLPNEASHARPGDVLEFVLTVENKKTRTRMAVDAGTAKCSLVRYNSGLARWEFLDTDDATWVHWAVGVVRAQHELTETPPGSLSYTHLFNTTTWGDTDIVSSAAHFSINGTPYDDDIPREFTGRFNDHAKRKLDPTGLYE